ncbi:hypothetical protein Fcan01_07224 [Folsomia candida]|uniref:Uncharacterized protein n=1 Tax=Folsomia candida TaxID=158441 RepID=A0A226EIY2_FOLCA|nr:hypothetical protein Fcan01_07224 [Folsomia candida]
MKMGHCLLIFIFQWLLLCYVEKCVSQDEKSSGVSPEDVLPNLPHVATRLPFDTGEVGLSSESEKEAVPFNKTVFLIPITGILLVIAMVLLYVFYTWKMNKEENGTNVGKPKVDDDFAFTEDDESSISEQTEEPEIPVLQPGLIDGSPLDTVGKRDIRSKGTVFQQRLC